VNAVERACGRCVDPRDQRVRVRAPQERDMQQLGKADIVDVAAFAGQERRIFEPSEARTDPAVALVRTRTR
jgi:hypothetical protein